MLAKIIFNVFCFDLFVSIFVLKSKNKRKKEKAFNKQTNKDYILNTQVTQPLSYLYASFIAIVRIYIKIYLEYFTYLAWYQILIMLDHPILIYVFI